MLRDFLRIGVVTAALSEPLLGTLGALGRSRPHVDLRVVEVDTPAGQHVLIHNEIDIAVIRLTAPTPTQQAHADELTLGA